jgi:hypothetical protein
MPPLGGERGARIEAEVARRNELLLASTSAEPPIVPLPVISADNEAAQPSAVAPKETAPQEPALHTSDFVKEDILKSQDLDVDIENIVKQEGGDADELIRMLCPAGRYHGTEVFVTQESVVTYLTEKIKRRTDCLMIPPIVIFFTLFGIMLLSHENIVDQSQVEREFRGMMEGTSFEGVDFKNSWSPDNIKNGRKVSGHKTLDDIDTSDDVYTYLKDAILPLFITPAGTPEEHRHRVLSYNQIIGGVSILQTRRGKEPCKDAYPLRGPKQDGTNPFYSGNFQCFPSDSVSDDCYGPAPYLDGFCPGEYRAARRLEVNTSLLADLGVDRPPDSELNIAWGEANAQGGVKRPKPSGTPARRLDSSDKRSRVSTFASAFKKQGRRLMSSKHAAKARMGAKAKSLMRDTVSVFVVRMHEHDGLEVALARLNEMRLNSWIDEQTQTVQVKVFVLNADLGVFTHASATVLFAESGELVPFTEAFTFLADPYLNKAYYALDAFWALSFLQVLVTCVVGVFKAFKRKALCAYFKVLFNWVEWFTVFGGIAILTVWLIYSTELGNLKLETMNVVERRPREGMVSALADYDAALEKLYIQQGNFEPYLDVGRQLFGYYTIFILMRFFRAFQAQPRLAIVTKTIEMSMEDMIHFLIVAFFQVMAFVCAGCMLFGHRLVQFSSVSFAFMECLQIMFGNFDFEELSDEDPVTVFVWFVCFIVLLTLIMVNMFLAIIMDIYSEAKGTADSSDSILVQTLEMFTEFANRKHRVPDEEVKKVIEQLPYPKLTASKLMESLPSMEQKQADEIIGKVELAEVHKDDTGLSLSDATRLIIQIKEQTKVMSQMIRDINLTMKEGEALERKLEKQSASMGAKYDSLNSTVLRLGPRGEARVKSLEARFEKLEGFLNEAMSYVVFRGKEVTTRLKTIEGALRGQRDQSMER